MVLLIKSSTSTDLGKGNNTVAWNWSRSQWVEKSTPCVQLIGFILNNQ